MNISLIIKLGVLLLGSGALAYISRASLPRPRSHGFWRFWAWEGLLALFLFNVEPWFTDPLSWHQIISWSLLLTSGFLVIHGVWLLKQTGAQDARRDDAPLFEFEKTTRLVRVGAYRLIRHPLYSSLLFLGWGIFFKSPGWLGGLLAVGITLSLVATARVEEVENIRFFGPEYETYRRETHMFVPFIF
jgi:protein-S-isoprenylcysteine O-methyltransferase Ste14